MHRHSKKEVLIFVAIVLTLSAFLIISTKDFMEQCRKDGYTETDCEMMATERNRRAFNNH